MVLYCETASEFYSNFFFFGVMSFVNVLIRFEAETKRLAFEQPCTTEGCFTRYVSI